MFAGDYKEPNFEGVETHESSTISSHPLRDDFKAYLQNELPGTLVDFSLQTVSINAATPTSSFNKHTLVRPVLCIELAEKQHGSKQTKTKLQRLPTKSISLLNRLNVSSLTNSSSTTCDAVSDDEICNHEPRKSSVSIDTLTAEWLVGVFLCRTSTDISSIHEF